MFPDLRHARIHRPALALAIAVLALAPAPSAADLKPPTFAAFERYVKLTEARMAGEISGASPFLWIDRQAAGKGALLAKLQQGEVVSARLETRDGKKEIDVPDGIVHHWVGTVLLPGATIERVMAVVKDYEQCESVSLTRDVPTGLGWLIKPFITSIPRETMEFTLGKVRAGVATPPPK